MAAKSAIRRECQLYMDKTRFIRDLERVRYAFLIHPRRFGKTCWLSVLDNYYDRNKADRFETLFGGTDIGRNPTPNRNRHIVLRFNFSAFKSKLETLRNALRNTVPIGSTKPCSIIRTRSARMRDSIFSVCR